MSNKLGESYTAKLGGKPVALAGDPDHDTVAVNMVGDALQETNYRDGKVTSISKMTVSADGRQMTTVATFKPTNRVLTLVANNQYPRAPARSFHPPTPGQMPGFRPEPAQIETCFLHADPAHSFVATRRRPQRTP
jgi:hypothetical protein